MNELQQRLLQTQEQLQRYNELNPRVKQFANKPALAPMEKSMQQEFKRLDPMKLQTDLSNLTKQLQDQKSQQEFAQKYTAGEQATVASINDKQKQDLMNKFGYDFSTNPIPQTTAGAIGGKTKSMYDELSNIFGSLGGEYASKVGGLESDITNKLQSSQDRVEGQFGPGGQQDQRLADFYQSMGDFMSSQQGKEQAIAQAQAQRLGADVGTTANLSADIARKQSEDVANLKAKEIQDYDNLYKTLNQYEQSFIQNYKGVKDDYYKSTLDMLMKMKMDLAAQAMEAQRALLQDEYARSMVGSSSGGAPSSIDQMMAYLNSQQANQQPTTFITQTPAPFAPQEFTPTSLSTVKPGT